MSLSKRLDNSVINRKIILGDELRIIFKIIKFESISEILKSRKFELGKWGRFPYLPVAALFPRKKIRLNVQNLNIV